MKTVHALAAVAALVMIASQGRACPSSEKMTPFLFEALPAAPVEAVAARVEILPGNPHDNGAIRARIVEMIRGNYVGPNLRMELTLFTSCDLFPQAGETGIVVGRVISSSPEALVIEPARAPSLLQRERMRIAVPTQQ